MRLAKLPQNSIPPSELDLIHFGDKVFLEAFDCGDEDLNAFIKNDAVSYSDKGIAKTYCCVHQGKPIGFFSVCADAINLSSEERRASFGIEKAHLDYPALKIARLGVDKTMQHKGIGTFMVYKAVGKALVIAKEIGCRFVTVDAYPAMAGFYCNLGFIQNQLDKPKQNLSLRLDLNMVLKE